MYEDKVKSNDFRNDLYVTLSFTKYKHAKKKHALKKNNISWLESQREHNQTLPRPTRQLEHANESTFI